MGLSELELARALNLILRLSPFGRDASRACAARFKQISMPMYCRHLSKRRIASAVPGLMFMV